MARHIAHRRRQGLRLFHDLRHIERQHITAGIFFSVHNPVIPAAGIGARALIGIAMIEITGKQATSGISDTQGTMNEDLQFHVRASLPDFLNLIQ